MIVWKRRHKRFLLKISVMHLDLDLTFKNYHHILHDKSSMQTLIFLETCLKTRCTFSISIKRIDENEIVYFKLPRPRQSR